MAEPSGYVQLHDTIVVLVKFLVCGHHLCNRRPAAASPASSTAATACVCPLHAPSARMRDAIQRTIAIAEKVALRVRSDDSGSDSSGD